MVTRRKRYLQSFPKPLLDDLVAGRWLPIVGAGFSRNAIVPGRTDKIPLWPDLGKALAAEIPGFQYSSALDAISAYAHEFSRPRLIERLSELLFIGRAQPAPIHAGFCSIPFKLVITTNFDFLLERSYEAAGSYCRPISEDEQLSVSFDYDRTRPSENRRNDRVTLIKLHGDLHHPQRLVATEEDYDLFLVNNPLMATHIGNLLIEKTPVLLGYSLEDPDMRQLWQIISSRLGKLRRFAYALQVGSSPDVIARFERRGVKVINLPGRKEEQGSILAAAFEELAEYWLDNLGEVSQSNSDLQLGQFSMPVGEPTRLCYYSIPFELMTFYKENAFPLAVRRGFVPVTLEDIHSPAGTTAAKSRALMEKSGVVVVDALDNDTPVEAVLFLSQIREGPAAVVLPEGYGPPRRVPPQVTLLFRPHDLYAPDESSGETVEQTRVRSDITVQSFLKSLDEWLRTTAAQLAPDFAESSHRLLMQGEYGLAVIAAWAQLETSVNQWLGNQSSMISSFGSVITFPEAMERFIEAARLQPSLSQDIATWRKIRNRVIHGGKEPSRREAEAIVRGILSIIRDVDLF